MKPILSFILLFHVSFSYGQDYTGSATELDYTFNTAVQSISLEMYDNNDTTNFVSASQNIGHDFRLTNFYVVDGNGTAYDLTSTRGGGYVSQGTYYKKDNANYFVKVLFNYLSVDELNREKIVHYPNPFSDKLTVELGVEEEQMRLTNMHGVEILSRTGRGTCELDLSHIAPGIYLLHVGNSVTRLVKD